MSDSSNLEHSKPNGKKENKECAESCAGIFTAPVLLPLLATIFEQHGRLKQLQGFTSEFGARFYGLLENKTQITLVRQDWTVPRELDGIVPFWAGQDLPWQLEHAWQ